MGYLLAAAVIALVAVWLAVVTLRHWGRPEYAVPAPAVMAAVAGAALSILGAAGMVVVRRHDVALLGALVATTALVGILSMFSVGLLLLLTSVGLAVVLGRRSSGSGPWAALSGVAMAVGAVVAAIVASQPPVVTCEDSGVRTSGAIWSGGSSSHGSAGGSEGLVTGAVTQGGATYSFKCLGDELVEFSQPPRSRSASTAIAALRPLTALTPPPGWVAAPHR